MLVSFTTASFSFPFIASCGKPQDPHLLILVTSVVLSSRRCGASELRLLETDWQSTPLGCYYDIMSVLLLS